MEAASEAGVPCHIARQGSMLTIFFNSKRVRNYDDARDSDTRRFARFFWEMLDRGIYLPCSQFEAWFLSAAMTPQQISQTIAAAREALTEVARV